MNELKHYGVKGMKWGVRRYQNADGSLTTAGKKRSSISEDEAKHLSEKARRSKLTDNQTISELKKLTAPSRDPNFTGTKASGKRWLKLDEEIRKFSGDWYESKGVSKAFKELTNKYQKEIGALDEYENSVRFDLVKRDVLYGYLSEKNKASIKAGRDIVDFVDAGNAFVKTINDPRVKEARDSYRKALNAIDEDREKVRYKYEDDLCGVVLNDLGYKDIPEARKLIRDTVIWD